MSDWLMAISVQLIRCILPIIIVVGTTGNLLNIIILTRPIFRRKSCCFYFLVFSINNLFYSSVILPYRLVSIGYQFYPNNSSIILCKLLQYLNDVCPSISPYFLVLTSIDRYCNSSTNRKLWKFNQITIARWTSAMTIILFLLFFLSTPIIIELRDNDGLGCRIRGDSFYNELYLIIQVLLLVIIAPLLMGLFGLMTIYNVKHVRIIPLTILQQRRTENQLLRMVLYQVGSHIILTLPMSITYLMILLPTAFSTQRSFYAIYTICYLPFYFSYGISFIIYVLSARLYRKQFIQILHKILTFFCQR